MLNSPPLIDQQNVRQVSMINQVFQFVLRCELAGQLDDSIAWVLIDYRGDSIPEEHVTQSQEAPHRTDLPEIKNHPPFVRVETVRVEHELRIPLRHEWIVTRDVLCACQDGAVCDRQIE